MTMLNEMITFDEAGIVMESSPSAAGDKKDWYLKGTFIQGDVRNLNRRIYPVSEIKTAVNAINARLAKGETVLGECDHPQELTINLDRVSHMITEMTMEGNKGVGKLKLIPTPLGEIIRVLIESGAKLGVSSRGSGNVGYDGLVSDFEIVTVDIVAKPSAPEAYPVAIYEAFNGRRGGEIDKLAQAVAHDPLAQAYLAREMIVWINEQKFKS